MKWTPRVFQNCKEMGIWAVLTWLVFKQQIR